MSDTKQWYSSKTVWGSLVAILAGLLQIAGIELDADGQMQLADSLVAICGAIGGILALYGRISAHKKLG